MAKAKKPSTTTLVTSGVVTTLSEPTPNRLEWVFGEIPIGDVIKEVFIQWHKAADFSDMAGVGINELEWLDNTGSYKTFLSFNNPIDPNNQQLENGTYQMRVCTYSGIREVKTFHNEFRSEWQTITID